MENMISIILFISILILLFIYFINFIQHKINKNHVQNKWQKKILSILPILIIVFIIRSFIYESFRIPSSSMVPNLLIGDFILVKKFAYGIRDPIFHTNIIKTSLPNRGDVIVFRHPIQTNINYIKRVIGIPGDTIIYNIINKKIVIIPMCNSSISCKIIHVVQKTLPYNNNYINNTYKEEYNNFYAYNQIKKHIFKHFFSLKLLEEKIENKKYKIILLQNLFNVHHTNKKNINYNKIWIVPKKKYFVMGDNRDNSFDSRYWGYVPEKNLVGQATYIWMSIKNIKYWFPITFRLFRIGTIN
ncbi:Signal peptidase I [Buchnera aphidicola (Eriosoma lanigerum)]|uniref:signal peptidase I n=1 Tax=Buchnera aphidicola TaxID=9 RepID=UPI0034643EA5